MHLIKVSIISLISMMMLMMLMKSMFQSYYLMLLSIEIKCGEAVRQPRTNKDSSANDRGAAHAHAYDRHAIVTTIEQQYTRALVHLYSLQFSTLSHCLSLTPRSSLTNPLTTISLISNESLFFDQSSSYLGGGCFHSTVPSLPTALASLQSLGDTTTCLRGAWAHQEYAPSHQTEDSCRATSSRA